MRFPQFQKVERQDPWREHLLEILQSMEIPPGPMADNVSASVAMYCREFHPLGVRREDLVLLIARAFCAVNDRAAAGRVLGSLQPHRRHITRWLEILTELHHFPSLLPYFSRGVIRPADWVGAQLDRMWTLDFARLALGEEERHEIMLYRSVRAIVESIFVFWDATDGEGVLGLKGLRALHIGESPRRGATPASTDDLLEYIADLFLRQKTERHWNAVPVLMNLDI
jgi:hypothetical protein